MSDKHQRAHKPTDDELRATYAREVLHRPHWPQSFQAAMADPLTAAIVRTLAAHPPTFGRRAAPAAPQWHGAHYWKPAAPREIDFKSRAAGEKPEPPDTEP